MMDHTTKIRRPHAARRFAVVGLPPDLGQCARCYRVYWTNNGKWSTCRGRTACAPIAKQGERERIP